MVGQIMNKTDLIEVIAETAELSKAASGRILDALLDSISGALSKGKDVSLVGFGTFTVSKRKQRTGRNPQTGETITIPAATVPRFKPGKGLKEKVNK